jgi:hypothetical protein
MSRKTMVGIVAVIFTLGLCSVALAGDPDRMSSQAVYDADLAGQSMHGSMQPAMGMSAASQLTGKPSMQEQKSAPCAAVLAQATVNATDRPSATSPCYQQYQDRIGGKG